MPTRDRPQSSLQTTVYDQEYFSGSQVSIYIGDILIDEVTSISMNVHQKKRPVYGYASQLYDNVSCGTVLVEGQFQINFKESGYLNAVLKRFEELEKNRGTPYISPFVSSDNVGKPTSSTDAYPGGFGGARKSDVSGILSRKNLQELDKYTMNNLISDKDSVGNDLTAEQRIDYYKQITQYHTEAAGFNTAQGAIPPAEKVFEAFENRVWQNDNLVTGDRRVDDQAFDGFTIYVTYGDFNRNDYVNHTVRRIDDVHLIGQAQEVNIGGTPIAEAYSFFAKNWV